MNWNTRGGGLTHNPPFVIDVQIDPQLNEFVPLLTGYMLDCITETAKQNAARQMFKELMENDQPGLAQAVQTLANLVEFYVFSENLAANQVEAAIRNTVQTVVNGYLAMAVNAFPQDFGRVLTDQQAADVQPYIGELENLQYQAQRFFQGGVQQQQQPSGWAGGGRVQQQQRGVGGGRGWQAGGGRGGVVRQAPRAVARSRWDEPDQVDGGYQPANDNWPGNNQQRRTPAGWSSGGGQRRTDSGGGNTIWDVEPPARKSGADTSFNRGFSGRQSRSFDTPPADRGNERRNVQLIDPRQTVVDGKVFNPARDNKEWPKVIDRNRLWDWILMEDGTQIRPAFLSDWKVTFDTQTPFTGWYDPNTQILFHYKAPDGSVTETAIDREETMGYLEHELNPELRRKAQDATRERDGKVVPAWQLVEQLKPNPSSPLATAEPLSDDVKGENVTLLNPDTYLVTNSLTDAVKRACLKLKVDKPEVLKQAFEVYVDRGVLTTIVNPDFQFLFQLTNAASYKQLFQLLIDAEADEELVKEVNRRIVTGINQAMTQNMGLKNWAITDFVEDYGDLIVELRKSYGDEVVETLEGYATEVISRQLAHYSEKELDETVRKAVGLESDVLALVWRERSSVTRLPFTNEDLNIPTTSGVMVSPTVYPEMHQTFSAIFDRTTDLPHTFYGRYIATSDGVVYSIVKGYLNDEAILIFKTDFSLQ